MKNGNISYGVFTFGVFLMHAFPLALLSMKYNDTPGWRIAAMYLCIVSIITLAISSYNFEKAFGEKE
jgi:hypothetical protein